MSFDAIFKALSKDKDPDSSVHKAGDLKIGSMIPFGIPSGIPRLDLSLGRPGLPAGRVVEYFGFEGSGKTTAALSCLAQAQRMGGGGLYIDSENSWDEFRAEQIGVDVDKNLMIGQVNTIEGIFRKIDTCIDSLIEESFDKPFVIIVDSITGVSTEFEREKKSFGEDPRVGQDARVIRQGMRRIMPEVAKSKACLIFVNHAISKIASGPYQKQSMSSGGHAIKFFASVRCEFVNSGTIKSDDKEQRLGQKVTINIEKLKLSRLLYPSIKEVNLLNDTGFDLTTELLSGGILSGLIRHEDKAKSYYLYETEFAKDDWEQVVADNGGPQKLYEAFLGQAIEKGIIRPWDISKYE